MPTYLLYQSVTMIWPSGLIDGIIRMISLSRIFLIVGESSVASRYTASSTICEAPISVEWILLVMKITALPSLRISSRLAIARWSALQIKFALERLVVIQIFLGSRRADL